MSNLLFTGVCTALVTPFSRGKIDFSMLCRLLDRQMQAGIRSIVICGTTGEASTLTDEEKLLLIERSKAHTGKDCMILAGTGSNNTFHAVALSQGAEEAGADGLLVVTPYYNKATSNGLYEHFKTISSSVHIPLILYNVPSRTGIDIPVSIYQQLSRIPNIAGVKEASTDITKHARVRSSCPKSFGLWSGNDEHIVPVMALGGAGVISVLSNVLPAETQAMAQAALAGDFDTAADLQLQLMPLIDALFCEVNPIPVKAAMSMIGYSCGNCRLPLTTLSEAHANQLITCLKKHHIYHIQ